jgi:hypothetical protein
MWLEHLRQVGRRLAAFELHPLQMDPQELGHHVPRQGLAEREQHDRLPQILGEVPLPPQ